MNDLKQLLNWNEFQDKIYVPNEIFNDLRVLHDKGSSHVAFAYSYYYLISWLYRFAKYGEKNIDVKMIKQVLGYSASTQEINYIIKKNGFLDQIGYTYSDTDYPTAWEWNDSFINFILLSDLEEDSRLTLLKEKGRNFKVKVPFKGIWRSVESQINNDEDGTFYAFDYTHEMSFRIFMECMQDKQLGVSGFYLYGYLKYRCDKFKKYQSSIERIGDDIGMSKNTADKYLGRLRSKGLISCEESMCEKVNGEFSKRANTYSIA